MTERVDSVVTGDERPVQRAEQLARVAVGPQWSAVGAYQSSGTRLSDAYEKFVNALVVSADPVQQQKIKNQQNVVQDAQNKYDSSFKAARTAFKNDPDAPTNFRTGFRTRTVPATRTARG